MERRTFSLRILLGVVASAALWLALARWHVGWALFVLACVPAIAVAVSAITSRRFRTVKIVLLLLCSLPIYPFSLPPFGVTLKWITGEPRSSDANLQIWNGYCMPLSYFGDTTVGKRVVPVMLSTYFDLWNASEKN